ncbi:hypothetical protein P3T76_006089 [Phytophthora citrophthora]|uniref:Uncharacterized protein n=1 Tax=Phytophthora citrophthora TaxID=4793 RepID=A0AAD9LMP1_9STRA|nr:hypothetical protein P3T76_006089 [Phytophthora citrophthora]
MSKLSKMKKSRSVNQAELMEMRRFANQDPDLIKIKPLVGTNPTKVSAEQLKVVQSYLKKHPKEGPNVVEWMVGASFLFIALFSAGMVKEIAS